MTQDRDYIRDIAEIRSMMERSSKFLSLSGWAGILAGLYALAGVWVAKSFYDFHPDDLFYSSEYLFEISLVALTVLILALVTAIFFSKIYAQKRGESIWNSTSKRLLAGMAVSLLTGAALVLLLVSNGLIGLAAPITLIFYGMALFIAGHYTIVEVRVMGVVQILLGLLNILLINLGLLFWALGFGLVHIVYGIYVKFRYER